MAVLNSGTILAVAEETVVGGGKVAAWANADVVPFQDDSGLTPATESLERSNFNGSFINCQALSGNESTSGNLNVELGIMPIASTEAGKLGGHLVFKSGLGKYIEQAADVDGVAFTISEEANPVLNATGYDLYRLSKPTEARTTLAVREFVGGTTNVIDSKGVVVDSLSFDFTAGQIVKVSNSVSGISYTPLTGITPLATPTCGGSPFVTKSAVFKVDGVTVDAQNVSLEIANENVDRQAITSTGISDKVTVGKSVTLSYTLDFTDVSVYTKLKNNTTGAIYIELTNTNGDEIVVYLPVVSYSELSKSNDGGIVTIAVTSMAYNDASGNAIYLATKKA